MIDKNNMGDVTVSTPDQNFQDVIRACPEAGYAKKIIVCEGKTEIGICRALDTYRKMNNKEYMSFKDCVYTLGGGDSFAERALKLKELRLDVAVFCDSDKDDKLNPSKDKLISKGIKIFDCEDNNSIEQQVFNDLPCDGMKELLSYKEKECSGTSIIDSVRSRYGENFPDNWMMSDTFEMRQAIGKTAKDGEWFKRIDRGEFLGSIVFILQSNKR
jgi:hypothetical protein